MSCASYPSILNLVFSGIRKFNYPVADPLPSTGVFAPINSTGYGCPQFGYYTFTPIQSGDAYVTVRENAPEVIFLNDFNAFYEFYWRTTPSFNKVCGEEQNIIRFLSLYQNVDTQTNIATACLDVKGREVILCGEKGKVIIPGYSSPIVIDNPGKDLNLELMINHIPPAWPISPWTVNQDFCLPTKHGKIKLYKTIRTDDNFTMIIPAQQFQQLADEIQARYISVLYPPCFPQGDLSSLQQNSLEIKPSKFDVKEYKNRSGDCSDDFGYLLFQNDGSTDLVSTYNTGLFKTQKFSINLDPPSYNQKFIQVTAIIKILYHGSDIEGSIPNACGKDSRLRLINDANSGPMQTYSLVNGKYVLNGGISISGPVIPTNEDFFSVYMNWKLDVIVRMFNQDFQIWFDITYPRFNNQFNESLNVDDDPVGSVTFTDVTNPL